MPGPDTPRIPLHLDIPPWIREITDRLETAGWEAYLVGGAIRDLILGRSPPDWDLTTSASMPALRGIFTSERHFVLRDLTLTLKQGRETCQITPFRGEGQGLTEDLASRDFTLNAMAYHIQEGLLCDPCGGLEDMQAARIKAVGDPRARFREDPLRLLRAVRLAVQLDFAIEPSTLGTLREESLRIRHVAPERIRDELLRLLLLPDPAPGLSLLEQTGLWQGLFPEIVPAEHLKTALSSLPPDPDLRLAALFHDMEPLPDGEFPERHPERHGRLGAEASLTILHRFRFPTAISRRVAHLIRHHAFCYHAAWSDAEVRRLIARAGKESAPRLVLLRRAEMEARGLRKEAQQLRRLQERIQAQLARKVPLRLEEVALDGAELMRIARIGPGPEVGRLLGRLFEVVLAEPEANRPETLAGLLRQWRKAP